MGRLRASERRVAGLVDGLDESALSAASACSAWSVGRVLVHLGSGAEIALAGLRAGLIGSTDPVPAEVMQGLWADYDALGDPVTLEDSDPDHDDRRLHPTCLRQAGSDPYARVGRDVGVGLAR